MYRSGRLGWPAELVLGIPGASMVCCANRVNTEVMSILDKAKDLMGEKAADFGISDVANLDPGALADKASALGIDPTQIKELIAKFTGGDGKLDLKGLLEAAKRMGLDVDKVKSLIRM